MGTRDLARRTVLLASTAAIALIGTFSVVASAQVEAPISDEPTAFGGVEGVIRAVAIAGADVWVGGDFAAAYDTDSSTAINRSNLARFDYNTGDLASGSVGVNAPIYALAFDGADTVYAGGDFTAVDGTPTPYLVAVNARTGAERDGFVSGANGSVYDLLVHDGWLYVAGEFTSWNDQAGTNLIRVDPLTGQRDFSFDPNPQDKVWDIAIRGDRIYAAGYFDDVGPWEDPVPRRWAAGFELDSGDVISADISLPALRPGERPHKEEARAIHASEDGQQIFVGDDRNLIRSFDSTNAAPQWAFESEGDIQAIAVRGDRLFVGNHQGWFEKFDGRILVALNPANGSVRSDWTPIFDDGDTEGILALAHDHQTLFAAGQFSAVNDNSVRSLAVFRSADWEPVEPLSVLGDADCDGGVSLLDALVISQYANGSRPNDSCPAAGALDGIDLRAADINGDGLVDIVDAQQIVACMVDDLCSHAL